MFLFIPLLQSASPPPSLVEPYPLLHGNDPAGNPAVASSPDPLVATTWSSATNITGLQRYETVAPIAWLATPASSFTGLDTLAAGKTTQVHVVAPGSLRLDFGREHAAWFEIVSKDLGAAVSLGDVRLSVSEYNEPWPGKSQTPKEYANGAYRLETNSQLYEGVRYAWIIFDPPASSLSATTSSWTIEGVKIVSQVKPVDYTGSFKSSDAVLEQAWYSGAYGSRLNMMPYGFNSILMDRGDRVSIQGDGHPTMAAALVAFGSTDTYELVHKMLVKTDSGCANASQCKVVDSGLMPYPIYWASSVNDWYMASGDTKRFLLLTHDMARIIDNAVTKFLQPNLNVAWFGWDDRVANGFCGSCNLEAQLGFAALTIRACVDFSATLRMAGDEVNATRYESTAKRLAKTLRSRKTTTVVDGEWWEDYGVHAAAYVINAKVVVDSDPAKPGEGEKIFQKVLTNAVTICSWSPFNQYWILQALGHLNKMDYAIASIKLCWGPMLTLGKGCFWELFSPEWTRFMKPGDKAPTRPSYCHPWADGVTHWLTHRMAGIVPLAPGFAEFAALPHVSGATPSVEATQRTADGGVISVRAQRDNVRGTVEVTVTSSLVVGSTASARVQRSWVGLRRVDEATGCALDLRTITVNGVGAATSNSTHVDAALLGQVHARVAEAHVYVALNRSSSTSTAAEMVVVVRASFDSSCVARLLASDRAAAAKAATVAVTAALNAAPNSSTGLPSAPPFPPAVYPAAWDADLDRTTKGSWQEAGYGKEGYVLFAFDQNGSDVSNLPTWVNSIKLFKRGTGSFVGSDASNASFLTDPRKKNGVGERKRNTAALGFVTAGSDGSQGTVLDVNVTAGIKYKLSLYMVSSVKPADAKIKTWSFTKQAIRVMDLTTLDPVAPDPLISNAPEGVYWTLRYDRSVRLRVMPIDSDAGYSAIFFDKL